MNGYQGFVKVFYLARFWDTKKPKMTSKLGQLKFQKIENMTNKTNKKIKTKGIHIDRFSLNYSIQKHKVIRSGPFKAPL